MASYMGSTAPIFMIINFSMYVTLLGLSGWAMNQAIDDGFIIGPTLELPAHFSPIYFPMGNAATGFFVTFALIAGVVGVASTISGFDVMRSSDNRGGAASSAIIAWALTMLAMGFAWREFELEGRNATLRTMEIFTVILSVTQFIYTVALHQ